MDFEEKNRLLSVDFYPFRNRSFHPSWLACYEEFAFAAKAAKGKQSYYIQTAIGNEFQDSLGVAEIAMQLNVAMAFGADWFGFYCYEMPRVYEGESYTPMYECTMMNPDGTPSPLYYAVQSETARLSAFSSAYLSYDWMKSVAVAGSESQQINQAFRYLSGADFADTSISQVSATKDTLVGCFNSDMGEAFMLVNYGNPVEKENSVIEMQFAKGEYAAVYGKDKEPQIVKLEEGKLSVELLTGEGCFVTLL
jgi:hypothetical protein